MKLSIRAMHLILKFIPSPYKIEIERFRHMAKIKVSVQKFQCIVLNSEIKGKMRAMILETFLEQISYSAFSIFLF